MAEIEHKLRLPPHTIKNSKTTTTIKLTQQEIVQAVKRVFDIRDMPDDAKVSFVSPRGGDWSGRTIDVDEANPVSITYTTETNEGG